MYGLKPVPFNLAYQPIWPISQLAQQPIWRIGQSDPSANLLHLPI
jgi:hypothetical protein